MTTRGPSHLPGAPFWYLARGRNVCGSGTWGSNAAMRGSGPVRNVIARTIEAVDAQARGQPQGCLAACALAGGRRWWALGDSNTRPSDHRPGRPEKEHPSRSFSTPAAPCGVGRASSKGSGIPLKVRHVSDRTRTAHRPGRSPQVEARPVALQTPMTTKCAPAPRKCVENHLLPRNRQPESTL